jgi:hypothetical protein
MAISINFATGVISVPQADLTSLGGGLYELDVDEFRLALRALEDDEAGIVFPITHTHNTSVDLSGVTYARTVEILSPYTVDFEDGTYTVKCVGANHNLGDVKVVDNVSLLIGNSAGLIQVTSGSGVLPGDITDIASAVWDTTLADHTDAGSTGEALDNVSGGSSPETIAGAVWDELVSAHTDDNSFGLYIQIIKSLTELGI